MNLLFKFFIFLGSLLVIILFGALIAPYFVNWDKFTSDFERQASRVLGQEVRVGGKTNLRILPLPFLSFENLQVGRNADGSPLMTVDRFSFNAELLPFLSGEVRIVEMSMQRPQVNLQVEEDGTIAWTNPQEALVDPEQVNIEKLNIQNGSILVEGLVGNRSLQVDDIQGELNAKSVLGPWRIDANATVEGFDSKIKIATGTFQDDGSMRLKMDLNRVDRPYNLLLDGPVKLKDNALSWDGEFRVSPFVKSQIDGMDKPLEPLPVLATGRFEASPELVQIPEYRLEIGSPEDPYTVTGTGKINIREDISFAVQADGRQVDIDALEKAQAPNDVLTLEKRLGALQDVLKRIPVPTAKGEIDVILPAVVAGDTYIRDIKTLISPTGNGWVVKNFQATFPGNTVLEAQGRLGLQNGFGFSGKILTASRQPSGFADWISGNVDATLRRLKSVGVAADLTITNRQVTMENVELRLDDALLKGKLQRLSPQGGKPALLAELKGNRVNVDDLLALYSLTKSHDDTQPLHDLKLRVKADKFEALLKEQPFVASNLVADVQLRDGTVSVNELSMGDFLGAKITTSGRIENVLSKPNGNMKLALEADNISRLLAYANRFLGGNTYVKYLASQPDLTKATKLDLELDTTETDEGADGLLLLNGITGGSELSLQLKYNGNMDQLSRLPISIDGSLSHSDPSVLMQQVGIKTLARELAPKIPGSLKLSYSISGMPAEGLETRVSVTGQDLSLLIAGMVSSATMNSYDADVNVMIGAEDISPFVSAMDILVPGFSPDKRLPLSTGFDLAKKKRDYTVSNLKGQMADNRFEGALKLEQETVSRPRLSGELSLGQLSLPLVAEAVFGRVTTIGKSLGITGDIAFDEESVFGEPLYGGVDANIKVSADKLALGKSFNGKEASLQMTMIDGAIDFNSLSFDFLKGHFDGALSLKNTSGNVLANMNYAIKDMDFSDFLTTVEMPEFGKGQVNLSGSLETNGQSLAGLAGNISGNGFIAMDSGEVVGLNPDALGPILSETGVENYELTSEKIASLFAENAFSSGFEISQFDTPFSLNRGKLRARNVRYKKGGTEFSSDLEYQLQDDLLEAETVISFTPQKRERISGSEPQAVIRWSGEPQSLERVVSIDRLEGYLSLRAFEASQRRLESLEAQVIEKQRLRGVIAYSFAKEQFKERKRLEAIRLEEERKQREAEEARKREEERLRKEAEAAEQARLKRLEEERRIAEEARIAKLKAELEERENRALRRFQQGSSPSVEDNVLEEIQDFLSTN